MSYPIMGSYYRPPAVALLAVLGAGTPLHLVPEPTNPVDKYAIMVLVESTEITEKASELLDEVARGYGHSAASILAEPIWHLGYVPKEVAARLHPFKACEGKLVFGSDGSAKVAF